MPVVWSDAVAAWEGNEISFFILQDSLLWMGAGSVKDHAHNVSTRMQKRQDRLLTVHCGRPYNAGQHMEIGKIEKRVTDSIYRQVARYVKRSDWLGTSQQYYVALRDCVGFYRMGSRVVQHTSPFVHKIMQFSYFEKSNNFNFE